MLHLDNLPRALLQYKGWWPRGSQNIYMTFVYIALFLLPSSPALPPPVSQHPLLSPQPMYSCDLCCVDAQTSGFVGLGINAFPGLRLHYFCVPCCVC